MFRFIKPAFSWKAFFVLILIIPNIFFLQQPFYQDELPIIKNVLNFFEARTILPYHTIYPTFYSYIVTPSIAAGVLLVNAFTIHDNIRNTVEVLYFTSPSTLIFPARLISLSLLLSTAYILYRLIKKYFDSVSAFFIFSLVVTTQPLLQYGSYGLPDIALLFFSTLSLKYCIQAWKSKRYTFERSVYLAALNAGFAISLKYNAISTLFPLFGIILLAYHSDKINFKELISASFISITLCVTAFIIGSPGWIFDNEIFLKGLESAKEHASIGHSGQTGIPILGQLELLASNSTAAAYCATLGVLIGINKKQPITYIATFSAIFAILIASFSAKQSVHYLLPGFPGLFILAGLFNFKLRLFGKTFRSFISGVIIILSLVFSYQESLKFLQPNTTSLAQNWMMDNIPENAPVATDWAYVPNAYSEEELIDIERSYSKFASDAVREKHLPYRKVNIKYSEEWLSNTSAEYFITSSLVYERFFDHGRFSRIKPDVNHGIYEEFRTRKNFYESLFSSKDWTNIMLFETGNGPNTIIFKRTETKTINAS